MKSRSWASFTPVIAFLLAAPSAPAQPFGPPNRDQPGDAMIQKYLGRLSRELDGRFLDGITSAEDWSKQRDRFKHEYFYMLGLDPLPERTPLKATVTGTFEGTGFVVEKLHYQSRPGLYVTANVYRPPDSAKAEKRPAVLYVCGHSGVGRNGSKVAYQSHAIWFARHGYVCLIVDTLELGEIPGVHHGTYSHGRWWWHSRGYTSAGVECWNGVRGIDYLVSRPDVDPDRIAVTGISGGGAATYWIAAADDRVKAAVPISGMADLESYVDNRVVNGHCDCMFLYNTFQWPWTRIAGLIAPRPMFFMNSDNDRIFPMDANDRISNRLERLYSLFGAGDRFDALVSVGGHAYRPDIRQGAYRWINTYLKDDSRIVNDGEVDLVTGSGTERTYPIAPEKLRAFATDADLPTDALNGTIDQHFVPVAKVEPPAEGQYSSWREGLLKELRRVTFRTLPERVPAAKPIGEWKGNHREIETEPGIVTELVRFGDVQKSPQRIVLVVGPEGPGPSGPDWFKESDPGDGAVQVYQINPRGTASSRWTSKNPPNTVERSLVLLGATVAAGQVRDVAAVARLLAAEHGPDVPVTVAGRKAAGLIGAYAALLEADINGVLAVDPPSSHMDKGAPALLNVLRVLDVPDALGMLAPRPLTLRGGGATLREKVARTYNSAGAADQLHSR